jgi:hypothetical protein
MTYIENLSGLTLDQIKKSVTEGVTGPLDSIWDSKYLPIAIGFVGVTAAFLVGGIIKKRKKKGKK